MKPKYRVTSVPIGSPYEQAKLLQEHVIKFEWWVTKETEVLLTADAYTMAIAVRLPLVERLTPLYEIH